MSNLLKLALMLFAVLSFTACNNAATEEHAADATIENATETTEKVSDEVTTPTEETTKETTEEVETKVEDVKVDDIKNAEEASSMESAKDLKDAEVNDAKMEESDKSTLQEKKDIKVEKTAPVNNESEMKTIPEAN